VYKSSLLDLGKLNTTGSAESRLNTSVEAELSSGLAKGSDWEAIGDR
jgi:hypothetical protein